MTGTCSVGAAIVLLTCDDLGKAKDASDESPRARQNVIFEWGYLMAKIKRKNVIAIAEDGVEIPSDLKGFVYSSKDDWTKEMIRDLKAMGFEVDANKIL